MRFNPPPNWPAPPSGWVPGPQWAPDPSWPPPPRGWPLWVPVAPVVAPVTRTAAPSLAPTSAPPTARADHHQPTTMQDSIVPTPSTAPSRLAVAAIVGAVVVPPVGIVLGVMARRQIRRTHEAGVGLAKAAIVVGGVVLVAYLVAAVVLAVLAVL